MKLLDKFEFRVKEHPGHTHSAKLNKVGDYEIKWARGWHNVVGHIEWVVADKSEVQEWVCGGGWVIVDDAPKAEDKFELPDRPATLPDEFCFTVLHYPQKYVMRISNDKRYYMCHDFPCSVDSTPHEVDFVVENVKHGIWKIIDKKPLTSEQIRANKDLQEQIAALEQSIKIQQQTVAHHERMIGNYSARIEDLKAKIVEEI